MEHEQKINYRSVEKYFSDNLSAHFSIQADLGNLFDPGYELICKNFRILYCQSNCGAVFDVDGTHYQLQRGDIVVVKPHTPHKFVTYSRPEEIYAGYVIEISWEYMRYLQLHEGFPNMDKSGKIIPTRGTLWERIDSLFMMTLEEAQMNAPGGNMALFGCSIILMVQIVRAASVDPNTAVKTEKQELLTAIISYVENNLSEKITLEDVANRFFVSSSTVTHLFTKKINISFYKYVMQRRLWKAQNLIREGMAMEKIAANVGFGDYSAFYRAFRQEFGMSPRQYYKETLETNQ